MYGTYVDVGLCKLDLSIFDAESATAPDQREALREALRAAFVLLGSLDLNPVLNLESLDLHMFNPPMDERIAVLDSILRSVSRAFAGDDRNMFDQAVNAALFPLVMLRIRVKDPTVNNAIEAVFAMMMRLRKWPLSALIKLKLASSALIKRASPDAESTGSA